MYARLLIIVGSWLSLQIQAQSTSAQCNGPITISTSADAESISSCDNFIGNVVIDASASGSLELNGLKVITGDLTATNATQLTSLSGDSLETIYGSFELTDLTILSTLQFPSLQTARVISWNGLPALQALSFTTGVSQADAVSIANTQLNDLQGLELNNAGAIDITNNPYLTTITFNDLTNLTESLTLSFNGRDLKLALPNLESAANITLRNVSNIDLASLSGVTGAMGIYSSYMGSLAFPSLSSTGNTFAVIDCPNLSNLSIGALTEIGGGLLLSNNTGLKAIDLPKLRSVEGSIAFSGSFSQVELPELTSVLGGADVETTASNGTICDDFNGAASTGVIKGLVTCTSGQSTASTNGNSSSSTPSGSNNSGNTNDTAPKKTKSSAGLIAGVVVGALVAIALAALAFWYFCIKRKRQSKPPSSDIPHPKDPELPLGGHHEKTELPADPNHVSELQGDRQHLKNTTQAKEVAGVSVIASNSTYRSSSDSSREARERGVHGTATITNPAELAWDQYEPRHELHGSDVPELRGERTL